MYVLGKKLKEDGNWVEFSGAELLVGRAGSVEFLKAQEILERPYKKKIAKGTLSIEKKREINLQSLAKSILLDWKGVQDEEGNEVAYTPEIGFEALENDPDLLEFIIDYSIENENFSLKETEDLAKKSSRSSTGKKSTATK